MRQVTDIEVLSLTNALQAETYALAIAKASIIAISDEQLKNLAQAGIISTEARIAGMQQFIQENQIGSVNSQTQMK